MALPDFSMRQLLEAGAHFGHQSHRWNPKMESYIFGIRNGVHIIDLGQTVPLMHRGLQAVSDTVARGGRVLFVGTKRQAADQIADAAKRCAQYFVNARWLGGMLTNWKTISNSIQRLRQVEETLASGAQGLTKKERLMLSRERDKLDRTLGGIKDMGGTPDLIFVIDTNKEQLAIEEARKLGIPVVAILDTNCNPDAITFPIPANDDAGRAISLYCDLVARAAIDGISRHHSDLGIDTGAADAPVAEPLPEAATEAPATEAPAGEVLAGEAPVAEAPAAVVAFERLVGPRGAPDDLKHLHGLGPEIEKKMNDAGIFHFWQVGAMSPEDTKTLDHELKLSGRIEREHWVDQARSLSEAG
jgi:small subunit ribosomal protein S2